VDDDDDDDDDMSFTDPYGTPDGTENMQVFIV